MFILDVFVVVVKKVIVCKMGVCGLRLIMELILLDMMFELFGLCGVDEVVINVEVVDGNVKLFYVYVK